MITKVLRFYSIPLHPKFEVITPRESTILGVETIEGSNALELIVLESPENPPETRTFACYTDNSMVANAQNRVYIGTFVSHIQGKNSGAFTPVRFCLFEIIG